MRLISASLATVLVLPALSCAQNRSAQPQDRQATLRMARQKHAAPPKQEDDAAWRLETVSWDPVKHELTWVITKGDKKGAAYKPQASEKYLINMDDATMTFNNEKRGFSKEEAANVHVLMDVISKYAVDSTVWWDDGQGEPLDKNGKPKQTNPPQHKNDSGDQDSAAILHVSMQGPTNQLDRRIQALEQQLALLRRLRMLKN